MNAGGSSKQLETILRSSRRPLISATFQHTQTIVEKYEPCKNNSNFPIISRTESYLLPTFVSFVFSGPFSTVARDQASPAKIFAQNAAESLEIRLKRPLTAA